MKMREEDEEDEEFCSLKGIYLGDRDLSFKSLITNLLKKGKLSDKYIDVLTNNQCMEIYSAAFTSEQVDENNNYQVYEQLGDLTGNKFIVWYIYKRFPQLKCAEGVKVAARLRINLGSKNSFSSIAENFGFWDFISATNDARQRKKKHLLEDVFEAFLGATETLIDQYTKTGNGYGYVFNILESIFDDIDISLDYEDLYDSKTRLKELFDIFSEKLGTLIYEQIRNDTVVYTKIFRITTDKKILIGEGEACFKADSSQIAASKALKRLALEGFVKNIPSVYKKFSTKYVKPKTTIENILKIIEDNSQINELFYTRGKSKYQTKYTSTILNMYCRKRDFGGIKNCIKLDADPNVKDSEGMSCLDMLLIGKYKEEIVYKSIKRLIKNCDKLDIQNNVYNTYYKKYLNSDIYSDFFRQMTNYLNILD